MINELLDEHHFGTKKDEEEILRRLIVVDKATSEQFFYDIENKDYEFAADIVVNILIQASPLYMADVLKNAPHRIHDPKDFAVNFVNQVPNLWSYIHRSIVYKIKANLISMHSREAIREFSEFMSGTDCKIPFMLLNNLIMRSRTNSSKLTSHEISSYKAWLASQK